MKAGRELDALVATKVMGWTESPAKFGEAEAWYQCWHDMTGKPLMTVHTWAPSTDIAAAWDVVKKFADRWEWTMRYRALVGADVTVQPHIDPNPRKTFRLRSDIECLTLPHAICAVGLRLAEMGGVLPEEFRA